MRTRSVPRFWLLARVQGAVQQGSAIEQPADKTCCMCVPELGTTGWVCSSLVCSMGMATIAEPSPCLLQGIHLSTLPRACEAGTASTGLAECLDPTATHLWCCWRAGVLVGYKHCRFLNRKMGSWKLGVTVRHLRIPLWPVGASKKDSTHALLKCF